MKLFGKIIFFIILDIMKKILTISPSIVHIFHFIKSSYNFNTKSTRVIHSSVIIESKFNMIQ